MPLRARWKLAEGKPLANSLTKSKPQGFAEELGLFEAVCGQRGCDANLANFHLFLGCGLVLGFTLDPTRGEYRLSRRAEREWREAKHKGVPWRMFEPSLRHGRREDGARFGMRGRADLRLTNGDFTEKGVLVREIRVKCPGCGSLNLLGPFDADANAVAALREHIEEWSQKGPEGP